MVYVHHRLNQLSLLLTSGAPSIYQLEKAAHQPGGTDTESQPLITGEEPEVVFTRALDIELEKISSFYALKEQELVDEANQLLNDVGAFEEQEQQEGVQPARPTTRGSARPSSTRRPGRGRSRRSRTARC